METGAIIAIVALAVSFVGSALGVAIKLGNLQQKLGDHEETIESIHKTADALGTKIDRLRDEHAADRLQDARDYVLKDDLRGLVGRLTGIAGQLDRIDLRHKREDDHG